MYTLFVLDFDDTYGLEEEESYGVEPEVYLIREDERPEVEKAADKAHDRFHEDYYEGSSFTIGDYFKETMKEENLFIQYVGLLHIPFGERQEEYLADYIQKALV